MVKLNDFLQDLTTLEKSNNPVACLILAHLLEKQTTMKPTERQDDKLQILRRQYERARDRVRHVADFWAAGFLEPTLRHRPVRFLDLSFMHNGFRAHWYRDDCSTSRQRAAA